jgi:hypothetical protein
MPYNFAAAFALYTGLGMNAVSRLKEANALLSEEHKNCLSRYDLLFHGQGSFSALRKLIAEHPQCIPVISIYCADKDKNAENSFENRILVAGRTNDQFFQQRAYLASLPNMPYRTDLMQSLPMPSDDKINERMEKRSNLIEPPRIIDLGSSPKLEELIKTLDFCLNTQAPLRVRENGMLFNDHKAKAQIAAYLRTHFGMGVTFPSDASGDQTKMREIIELCAKVIVTFDEKGRKSSDISDLRTQMAKLTINRKPQRLTRQSITIEALIDALDMPDALEEEGLPLSRPVSPTSRGNKAPPKENELNKKRRRLMLKTTKAPDLSIRAGFTPLADAAKKSQSESSPQLTSSATGEKQKIKK